MAEKILIENGILVTMEEGETPEVGDLWVVDERIQAVGGRGQVPESDEAAVRIDASGCAVLPGLINLHTHTPMTLYRSTSDDLGFPRPGGELPFREGQDWRARITPEDHYWSARLAIAEMIRTGTTTFVDMYHDMDQVARAVIETGMRAALGWEIYSFRRDPDEWLPYDEATGRRTFEAAAEFASRWHGAGDGRVTAVIAPHEPGTCHEPWLSRSARLAEEMGLDITIHVAESVWEVEVCRERYGLTPVEAMDRAGLFRGRVIGAHNLYLQEGDLERLATPDYTAVSCIGSYVKLATEVTPVPKLHEAGVRVGLGTDSAATNNNLNLWEEIYLTATLHGFLARDPSRLPGHQALHMATVAGAQALGREEELGTLAPGKKADLIVVDLAGPHLHPLEGGALYGNLQYALTGLEVRDLLVDGRFLLREGEIQAFDEAEVIANVDKAVRRLRDAVGLPEHYVRP